MNTGQQGNNAALTDFDALLAHLMEVTQTREQNSEQDTPIARLTREFFANNWATCRNEFLSRTEKIRLIPELSPAPRAFRFEVDVRFFKRKLGPNDPVELMPGPIRGEIIYRHNLLEDPTGPTVAVFIDRDLGFFHPNFSRERGILCIGDQDSFPPGPLPLDQLIENHLYPILTYQNRRPSHPMDISAAQYFALDRTAMEGLESVEPLY